MSNSTPIALASVRRIEADGVSVFYREAGPEDGPVLLLLHGFPASSFQYRELMLLLADRYRVIAPDFPGFGFTEVPADRGYVYTFDALAKMLLAFTEALALERYALYIFDYGAPVGLRLAMARPERVTAIISQMATHMKRVWETRGHRSGDTGTSLPRRTARLFGRRSARRASWRSIQPAHLTRSGSSQKATPWTSL